MQFDFYYAVVAGISRPVIVAIYGGSLNLARMERS